MANISFVHPHLSTSVVDNSVVTTHQSNSGTALFMPYFSDRGVSNKVELFTSYTQFILEKGTPNFKKHGQAIYNIVNFLSAGGVVYGVRCVPDDAVASSVDITVIEKSYTPAIPDTPANGETPAKPGKAAVNGKGVKLSFAALGEGVYGNAIKIILNKKEDGVLYELVVTQSGAVVEGPYTVSLTEGAQSQTGTSIYIQDVLKQYSRNITCKSVSSVVINETNGVDNKGAALPIFEFVESALVGGTDGTLTTATRNAQVKKAFDSEGIRDNRQYPIDVLLDAKFSEDVKRSIVDLANVRGDVVAYIDIELNDVNDEIVNIFSPSARQASVWYQDFVVRDAFTNVDMLVSFPYFLASMIPGHDSTHGIQAPIAGPARGAVSGFKAISHNPTREQKERLYKSQVNYAEQDYRGTKIMSQLTSQPSNSALSNINNVRVLSKMVRRVEEISENYFFEFASPSTLSHFEGAVNSYLSNWVGNGACTVARASVYQNEYDVVEKIVRVRCELAFTGIIERIIIEFNVG